KPSSFLMVTVAPALTGPATLKAVSFIVMSALPEPLELLLELLLHAASERASAATTRTRMAKRERRERGAVLSAMPKDTYEGAERFTNNARSAGLPGETQRPFADHVALDLVGAGPDG